MSLSCVEWGVATRTLAGESTSGDHHVVLARPDGVLVGVIDGLGHGVEAARAAQRAESVLAAHASESLIMLARDCHSALVGTRGVVMTLARFTAQEPSLVWLGVGNIEGVLLPTDHSATPESLVPRAGVVGDRLPALMATILPVVAGDTLVLATDGVRADFAVAVDRRAAPHVIADALIREHSKDTDDALVLVVRYQPAAQVDSGCTTPLNRT